MTDIKKLAGMIRSLVCTMSLRLECVRVLEEGLVVLVLMYVSEALVWREKERSRIRTVQMKNLKSFFGKKGMDGISNPQFRELWMKGLIKVFSGV